MSKETLTAVIVEDELAGRETLIRYIERYCPSVTVLEAADGVKTGVAAIREHKPDVVFLDVEMPYGNAFDLLEEFDQVTFDVIFVTAYSNYAVKALNFSAAYYVLKPIDIDDLVAAVEKVQASRKEDEMPFQTRILLENIHTANQQHQKVVLPVLDGFEVVQVKDIIRMQANDNFTDFHLTDGSKKVICRPLKHYEELLAELNFLRVHRSHLVNLQFVKGYKKGKGGQLAMSDGSMVDVAPSKKQELLAKF
jgi:two-component system LytT family response regulator